MISLSSIFLLACLFLGPSSTFTALAATVSSTPAQTITGIGGSGAWWPHDLYQFPEATRQNISNLLFSQDGLGLSSYRWNVGAGGVGVGNPGRAPDTFYRAAGSYNWSADPQGRTGSFDFGEDELWFQFCQRQVGNGFILSCFAFKVNLAIL
ncbi:hypothetical protein PM082_022627 [Marasmius tenuissimus]|nr:hypothetical protein PM082_022627 [Marasmius tenuissimus]